MFGTASGATIHQRKVVGADESLDTANKVLQRDALSKLEMQAGADNTMDDVLGGETADLIKNPPAVPQNTPERDRKNQALVKKAKKAKKKTFQIRVSTGPYGTVFVDGAEDLGTIEVMQGEPQTFDFIPDEGCKLVRLGLALTTFQALQLRSECLDLTFRAGACVALQGKRGGGQLSSGAGPVVLVQHGGCGAQHLSDI
jgi:hypothetical protein